MSESRGVPVIWCPLYEVDIGRHVFPMEKYRLIKERLEAEGSLAGAKLRSPEAASEEDVLRVHAPAYWQKVLDGDFTASGERMLEIPFPDAVREAFLLSAGGTTLAGRLALSHGRAVHLGGGFHHAFADHGEGFCLLNDLAIAAASLVAEGAVERIAIVDLDVHHGNGTAAIFADDARIFTFPMHHQWNYPAIKPRGDLDVGLEDGVGDGEYLALLEQHLPNVLDDHKPQLIIYLAELTPTKLINSAA